MPGLYDKKLVQSSGKSSFGLAILLTLTLVIFAEQFVESVFLSRALDNQAAEVHNKLSLIRANIEGVINANILLVQGFSSVIATKPDIDQDYFANIAKDITKNSKIIRNIAAAPDMVISLMYPMKGNEAAIGLNYKTHPTQREAALKVVESGKLVLAGPLELKQGGIGFIARIPVITSIQSNNENGTFWGLLSSVFDADLFYQEAGLHDPNLDIQIAIKGSNAKGTEGEQFFGPDWIYQASPVTQTINLPYGSWQLAAVPSNGWVTSSDHVWSIRLVAIVTLILLLSLISLKAKNAKQKQTLDTELKAANHRFTSVLDGMNAVVYVADMQNHEVLYANPKTKSTFGDDIVGKKCWQTLQRNQKGPCDFCTNPRLVNTDGHANPCISTESVNTVTDLWMHSETQAIPWDDGHLVRLEVATDITKIKENEALLHDAHKNLESIAYFDPLTNLPNRRLLTETFQQSIVRLDRNEKLAICYLDLDGFKLINDRYGHNTGDDLLIQVSNKLKAILRDCDTIARWGGDEFCFILQIEELEILSEILERIMGTLSGKYTIDHHTVSISSSIGVAIYPQDETDLDALLRKADQAMYTAKQKGKKQFCLFDSERDKQAHELQNRQNTISDAIRNNEMVLYYQPQISVETEEICGVEALIRWIHPDGNIIPPLEFLPHIQRTEVQCQLDLWVFETAIKQVLKWREINVTPSISINISPYSLQQPVFIESIYSLLEKYTVEKDMISLEILESDLADIDTVNAVITGLIQKNLSFALDDYGTGYSSLTYLRQLPVDTLKIDQTFVRDMLIDENDLNIVEGVIGLAKAFNKYLVAEGVETVEHGCRLAEMGCSILQGYGIARPMPAKDLENWLQVYQIPKEWSAYKV